MIPQVAYLSDQRGPDAFRACRLSVARVDPAGAFSGGRRTSFCRARFGSSSTRSFVASVRMIAADANAAIVVTP